MSDAIVEYAGLTKQAASLVEAHRKSPNETKSDILVRLLSASGPPAADHAGSEFDLGQGAKLRAGEKIFLFLSEEAKKARRAHAIAEVKSDGFYLLGNKIEPSKGSVLQPAMHLIQEKLGHRNEKGEIISLSAWRQWHVERGGKLVPVLELKDPALARKRGRAVSHISDKTAEELGF
jgi:hypothetical protein